MAGAITILNYTSLLSLVLLMITGRWVGIFSGIHHPTAALGTMVVIMVTEITAVFYLLGAGKEIRVTVQRCGLDPGLQARAVALRRRVLPPAMYTLLALVLGAVTGAAADTRVVSGGVHGLMTLLLFGIVLTSAVIQIRFVKRTAELLGTVRTQAVAHDNGDGR